MKSPRTLLVLVVALLGTALTGTTIAVAAPSAGGATAAKKTKPKKPKKPKSATYTAVGSVIEVNADAGTVDIEITKANPALRKEFKKLGELTFTVGQKTDVVINGEEDNLGLDDVCNGDSVSFSIRTTKHGKALLSVPAAKVAFDSTDQSDCGDGDPGDDSGDGSYDDSGDDSYDDSL